MTNQRMGYLRGLAKGYRVSFPDRDGYIGAMLEQYIACQRSEMFDATFAGKKEGEVVAEVVEITTIKSKRFGKEQVGSTHFDDFAAIVRIGYPDLTDEEIRNAIK
jgi:hypothetical protein